MIELYAGPRPDHCLGCATVIKPGDEVVRFDSKWFLCFACCESQVWQGADLPLWDRRPPTLRTGPVGW